MLGCMKHKLEFFFFVFFFFFFPLMFFRIYLEIFRKGRGTRDQIANICWIIEKAR